MKQNQIFDRKKMFLYGCALILVVLTISMFSSQNDSLSYGLSGRVTEFLEHLFGGGSGSAADDTGVEFYVRKAAHIFLYFLLGSCGMLFMERATVFGKQGRYRLCGVWAGGLGILVAGLDEWNQTGVAGRTGKPQDVLVDAVGIALGIAVIALTRTPRNRYNGEGKKK